MLAWHWYPRAIRPPTRLPRRFGFGHCATKVPRRTAVANLAGYHEQPLGGDPTIGGAHPLGDQLRHGCRVAHPWWWRPTTNLADRPPLERALDRLGCG